MKRSSRVLQHENQKFDFFSKKFEIEFDLCWRAEINIQVGLTYMSTSGMHRRPFEGRHLVLSLPVPLMFRVFVLQSRLDSGFYRRLNAVQFDVRYIATNAEKFNQRGSVIVKQARIVTELCLYLIKWEIIGFASKINVTPKGVRF